MLLRQQRSRHQHRHLLIVGDGEEGRAHRHFGFTETHVAADQTIHRQRLSHIGQYGIDGLSLVRRGFKREGLTEQLILLLVMFEGETGFGFALGVDIQQLGGDVAHLFGGFLPRF